MRTLTLTLRDSTGRLEASETTGVPTDYQPSAAYLLEMLTSLRYRLDVLERDGSWNNGQPSQGKEGPAVFHEKKSVDDTPG